MFAIQILTVVIKWLNFSIPTLDRGAITRADESNRHRRQVPRRQTQAPLHVA